LEEGTWAAWLYDVLKPHVHEIVVCNPRRNALLKEGSKNDKVDARKLSELLRAGLLRAVYHGENGLRSLQELARSYEVVRDHAGTNGDEEQRRYLRKFDDSEELVPPRKRWWSGHGEQTILTSAYA
jgi:hypothetical protein